MRDYSKISPRLWTGTTGRKMRAEDHATKVVAFYLMTSPNATMLGVYYQPIPSLTHEAGISIEEASKALRRLHDLGFAEYDMDTETVWVCEMARHQVGETLGTRDLRHKYVLKESANIAKTPFYDRWMSRYAAPFNIPLRRPIEAQTSLRQTS